MNKNILIAVLTCLCLILSARSYYQNKTIEYHEKMLYIRAMMGEQIEDLCEIKFELMGC